MSDGDSQVCLTPNQISSLIYATWTHEEENQPGNVCDPELR